MRIFGVAQEVYPEAKGSGAYHIYALSSGKLLGDAIRAIKNVREKC